MALVRERAPAKINLDLLVVGRRDDGYHELDSVVVFAEPADSLTFEPASDLSLEIEGPFADALVGEADNLILRAARDLALAAGVVAAAAIRLEKRIPVAAGVGGGSADAAATLRGLVRLWDLALPGDELLEIARRLGADVPVCLIGRPARMRGLGERIEVLEGLPALDLVLVNPRRPVPTGGVFKALAGRFSPVDSRPVTTGDLAGWLASRTNDLEAPARWIEPAVEDVLGVLRALPGCRLARMSGSGATCFGIFETADAAARGAAHLAVIRPGWWTMASGTGRG